MISLTIDGKKVSTGEGKTILEAARESGIYIPTFCYHEKLLPIGSCRLCLVEVDGYNKPMTACTTPALEGIKVTTQSDSLLTMRRQFLQMILTAHPLDCPQCDKGGECELQNISCEHGIEMAQYQAVRTDHKEKYATPLIRYWESRCVLCGRCFHACHEVSGRTAIDIVGNGFESRVASVDPADCISCGECLSVCPIGALTETLSPVKARTWQSERTDTTCPHCGFGCQFTLSVIDGKTVTKVVTDGNMSPNYDSLCVRGRFGYDFVNSKERICEPFQVTGNQKRTVTNEEAIGYTVENLKKIAAGGKGVGFVVSPRVTNEEMFLVSKIAAALSNSRVASSAACHTGKIAAAYAQMGISPVYNYENIRGCKTIVVAGADLLTNNHVLANKVREAVKLDGAKIVTVDPLDSSLARISSAHLQTIPGKDAFLFNAFSARLLKDGKYSGVAESAAGFADLKQALAGAEEGSDAAGVDRATFDKAYGLISGNGNICVIYGSGITSSDDSLNALLNFCMLKGLPERGLVMPVALQANALGAVSLFGVMSATHSLLEDQGLAGIFLYEDDPFTYLNGEMVRKSLSEKQFVLACDILPTMAMESASIVIPSATFAEKDGSCLSGNGVLNRVNKACRGKSSGFEFLNELLQRLGGKGYENPSQVTEEIKAAGLIDVGVDGIETVAVKTGSPAFAVTAKTGAAREEGDKYRLIIRDIYMNHHLADVGAYSQGVSQVQVDLLRISPEDAVELGVSSGDLLELTGKSGSVKSPVTIKKGIRKGVLEFVLFRRHQEVLSLFAAPSKVVDVVAKKA